MSNIKTKDSFSHIERNIAKNFKINDKKMEVKREKRGIYTIKNNFDIYINIYLNSFR